MLDIIPVSLKEAMTIEAAMIELNRLKTTERMDIDRDELRAAVKVAKTALNWKIAVIEGVKYETEKRI